MKKSKVTRSLLAACSIVALSAVMYGCTHSGDDGPTAADLTAEQERAEEAKQAQEKAEQAQMDLDAAITAEASARMAVAGLSATSTDAEVMDARTKLAAAQAAVMKLAEDHALRTSVAQLDMDLQGVETARTVASQLMTVNDAHDMAKMAVDELDRAGSTAQAVAEARTKVDAAQAALNAATALSEEQRTSLGSMIMAVDGTLDGIEAYRATDAGQLAVAEAAVDAAEGLVDALTAESTPAEAGAAYTALQRAIQAVAAAEDLPDNVRTRLNAKIDKLQKQATGQSSITLALAEATTAVNSLNADSTDADVAAARTKVAAAVTAAEELPDDDARKMAIAALDKNLMGIEQARTDEGNKPGLDANAMALATNIDQDMEGNERPTVTINDGMPLLTGDNRFADSTMSIASIDGWMGNAYSRTNEAVVGAPDSNGEVTITPESQDHVAVYNNKGSATPTRYIAVYNTARAASIGGIASIADTTGAITFDANPDTVASHIMTTGFPTETGTRDHDALEALDGDTADGIKFLGSFHGVSGTYDCATGCEVERNVDKSLTLGGTWIFTPNIGTGDSAAQTAALRALMVDIADADYMHFGYWKNTTMMDGKPVYMVDAFFGGTDASTLATVQARHGSATYAGSATGLYVSKELDSSGDPQHLYHGQFTADANLTASFGGTSVAANDAYSIKGEITNFMNGDKSIDPTWSVTLMKTAFDATNGVFDATNANMFIGGVTEGDKGMLGSWSGQFFGETAAVTDDAATNVDESFTGLLPTGVAGRFDGHFVNGHVLGAFGADIVED